MFGIFQLVLLYRTYHDLSRLLYMFAPNKSFFLVHVGFPSILENYMILGEMKVLDSTINHVNFDFERLAVIQGTVRSSWMIYLISVPGRASCREYTLPKTDIVPENRPSGKKIVSQAQLFRDYVNFGPVLFRTSC